MRQSQAAQLTATQPASTHYEAHGAPFLAALIFHFLFFAFVTFPEQLSHGYAAQLAATQRPTTQQEAQGATFFAALIFHFVFLTLATFPKQVPQEETA